MVFRKLALYTHEGEFYPLCMHPGFEWLRVLSQLMVPIDELSDQDNVGNQETQTA